MAKVTRKNLPRGVVLTVDHVFDPIEAMDTELEAVAIESEQKEAPYSTFRVNLNTPWIDSKYFFDNATTDGDTISETATSCNAPYYIPFCLPPTQDYWPPGDAAVLGTSQPVPILDEICFSFDQADEPCAIMSQWFGKKTATAVNPASTSPATYGGYLLKPAVATGEDPPSEWVPNPYAGKKSYDRTDAYEFRIVIYEKEQFAWSDFGSNSNVPGEIAEDLKEVVSIAYPATNFIATTARFNPAAVSGINRQFSPYKTYVAALYAPRLHDFNLERRQHAAVISVWIGLKFKMEGMERDIGGDHPVSGDPLVQNIPTRAGSGARQPEVISILPPAADTPISADVLPGGINTNLQKIDQVFHDKIRAGYSTDSMTYPEEQIKQDAGYEVIAVPIGGGFAFNRMSARDDYPVAPYTFQDGTNFPLVTSTPNAADYTASGDGVYVDRRLIPIVEPFVLHHVVFALNHTSDRLPISWPHLTTDDDVPNWMNATVPSGGSSPGVGSLAITVPGAGYAIGSNIATTTVTGSGTGLTVNITAVDPGPIFRILAVEVASPGYGYVTGDTVTVDGVPPPNLATLTVSRNTRSVRYDVGVGLVSGPGGDEFEYQQLAYNSYTNGKISPAILGVPDADIIDAIKMGLPAMTIDPSRAEYKLITVPLVGADGKGYTANGPPAFVGNSTTYSEARDGISDGAGVDTYADAFNGKPGIERYLEVRLEVNPLYDVHKVDPLDATKVRFWGDYKQSDIFIGYGGCWVYLIGKKHLT